MLCRERTFSSQHSQHFQIAALKNLKIKFGKIAIYDPAVVGQITECISNQLLFTFFEFTTLKILQVDVLK
jgi:hypothetical protein